MPRYSRIEIGKQADMAIISTNSIHSVPLFDPITHLVYSCSKSDVKHVYIAGKQCVKDGSIINFDLDNVIQEVKKLKMPTLDSLL